MKIIRDSNEHEMILAFLKGEINSNRFNNALMKVLKKLCLDKDIIIKGDINNDNENKERLEIMKLFRGYPTKELFKNFPDILQWKLIKLSSNDINNIYYINYDYWNELSNNTSSPVEAAKSVNNGIEIYGISNKQFLDGIKYLEKNKFPPVILITCSEEKYLIIEGHLRMTVYGLEPSKLEGTYAYVGYCTPEEMEKYDSRMLINNASDSKSKKLI